MPEMSLNDRNRTTRYKVLLADDEREEREGIQFLIQKYQYPLEVVQAANGAKALEYMEQHSVDILFTDVKMPVMNGLELAKKVNQRWPETIIVIFSAYGEFEYAKQAMEANAVNYLLKPIELDEFQKVMIKTLDTLDQRIGEKEKSIQANRQSRYFILYKLFTGAQLDQEEDQFLRKQYFSAKKYYRMLYVEAENHLFEEQEELFLNLVRMYMGSWSEYVNLFPTESCILFEDEQILDWKTMETQLRKIIRDVQTFQKEKLTVTVSRRITDLEDLKKELLAVEKIRETVFGIESMVLWTEKELEQTYFSQDAESVCKQIVMAVKARNQEVAIAYTEQLISIISTNKEVSRIYVTNLFYSLIREIYQLAPNYRLEYVYQQADALFLAANNREMIELFHSLMGEMIRTICEEEQDESQVIMKIRRIVEQEYMKDLSLNEIAGRVNLVPAYVSYIFKQETGKTLIKYLNEIRMEKAGRMLEEGNEKMNQIAKACGYLNPSYFNRAFKSYYGVTPRQYKEKQDD